MSFIITLTTDFGYDDAYVAVVKGAILSTNPEANIIDISHSIEPQNILQAAFVGSERKGIILKTPSALFVAPDNGILSYIIDDLFPVERHSLTEHNHDLKEIVFKTGLEAVAITDPRFWRHPVSPTFHGRDIFAPVGRKSSPCMSSLYQSRPSMQRVI